MFNFHEPLEAFHDERVRLTSSQETELRDCRDSNRARLISAAKNTMRIGANHFIPQGSVAIRTVIQQDDCNYDIDDGVWFYSDDLQSTNLEQSDAIKRFVADSLADPRFSRQPEVHHNCVRVFYATGVHVDVPCYRLIVGDDDAQELAADGNRWVPSDPTEITRWFERRVAERNSAQDGAGTAFRRATRLLKRFACSRGTAWDVPNGLKLVMLSDECFEYAPNRIDIMLADLLGRLRTRLTTDTRIYNLAQALGRREELTKGNDDSNVIELRAHLTEALEHLAVLHDEDRCTYRTASRAWDWVLRTDGFFADFDNRGGGGGPLVRSAPSTPFVKSETRFG